MLKENAAVFRRLMIILDILVVSCAFFSCYFLNDTLQVLYPIETYVKLLPFFALTWVFMLYIFGMYYSFRAEAYSDILLIIFEAMIFGFVLFINIISLLKLNSLDSYSLGLLYLISISLIVLEKFILVFSFHFLRRKGYNYRDVLIVGTGLRAQNFIDLLKQHSEWGFRVIGLVDEDVRKKGQEINGHNVIGSFEDLADILHNNAVAQVIFVVPRLWLEKIEDLVLLCETEGIPVSIAVDLYQLKLSRAKQTDFHGFPLLTFESTPDKVWHLFIKRAFDIIFSGIALFVLLPLFILIALFEKISKGTVFFNQERCGLNGRKFKLYKFRTMVMDAESKLGALAGFNEMGGPAFKMKNDPRVTKLGLFLRKFSIDEFPQFWNVFRGDMSVIGPRPPLPLEVVKYDNWQRRRLSMKPGLTCLWQIKGRNEITDFNEWMKLDLEYIDNWSLWLDLKIILKTIPVVLLGNGAK